MLHDGLLLHAAAGERLQRLPGKRLDRDAALGQFGLHHIHHAAELGVMVGGQFQRQGRFLKLHARAAALKVKASGDFLLGLLDRVAQFLKVDFGDEVKAVVLSHRATRPY